MINDYYREPPPESNPLSIQQMNEWYDRNYVDTGKALLTSVGVKPIVFAPVLPSTWSGDWVCIEGIVKRDDGRGWQLKESPK